MNGYIMFLLTLRNPHFSRIERVDNSHCLHEKAELWIFNSGDLINIEVKQLRVITTKRNIRVK